MTSGACVGWYMGEQEQSFYYAEERERAKRLQLTDVRAYEEIICRKRATKTFFFTKTYKLYSVKCV